MSEIEFGLDGGLADIRLNRPARKNALRRQDWAALGEAVAEVGRSDARALMIRGAGGAFCAGFDISEIEPEKTDAFVEIDQYVNPALVALRNLPIPTIAAVEGACVGGGFGIAAACDIVVCAENARFGSPYGAIGITADAGLHYFLRETLGYQRAAYLIFTGKLIGAEAAMAMGLCSEIHPVEDFETRARAFAAGLAAGPTTAMAFSKKILQTASSAESAMDAEALVQARVFATRDASIGIKAFLRGQKPEFTGR